MVREIVKDTAFLSQKCEKVTNMVLARKVVQDLIDTAKHNNETNDLKCCGLAANQIGEQIRVIIAQMPGGKFEPFINPIIVGHSDATFESTEGCMSLVGQRTVERYRTITVMAQNMSGKWIKRKYSGFTAVELQHEIDHINGILI
jgi:peptide deformylase